MTSSWVPVAANSDFSIRNLPFGVFSTSNTSARAGVAIGDFVLDVFALHVAGLLNSLEFDTSIFGQPTLNSFIGLERKHWRATRQLLMELLSSDSSNDSLRSNEALKQRALIPSAAVKMHLPADIHDYTDFYSSREHATNVGIMFRGKDNALQPNWLHLPVGYHGRSSSVVISGTDVVRPAGQLQADREDASKGSVFSSCRLLDFELEMAFFVGGSANPLGRPLTMAEAEDRIFGVVVMNDWSARDIQAWEYVPLGPFTAKNFCTTVSPWIVSLDALAPFKCSTSAGPVQDNPAPLAYLQDPEYASSTYDVRLEVAIQPEADPEPSVVSVSNLRYLYWNFKQQLVHHSVTGCPMRPGDLLGSGTISGPVDSSLGSMLELSWRGAREVVLANSPAKADGSPTTRKFLQDGDTVIMSAYAEVEGLRVGFGSVRGKILPAGSATPAPAAVTESAAAAAVAESAAAAVAAPVSSLAPAATPFQRGGYTNFRLYSYWRSGSSWRVRLALALKGIPYECVPVNLLPLVGNVTEKLPSELVDRNPLSQVPVLEFTDTRTGEVLSLTQSLAIIEFLDEISRDTPASSLLPADPLSRGRARQIAEIINSGIQPLQNINILRKVKTAEIDSHAHGVQTVDGTAFARSHIEMGLASLEFLVEEALSTNPHGFAAGTSFPTVADICLIPQIYSAKRFNVDVSAFPAISAVVARCEVLPAFRTAHADAQPDAPTQAK